MGRVLTNTVDGLTRVECGGHLPGREARTTFPRTTVYTRPKVDTSPDRACIDFWMDAIFAGSISHRWLLPILVGLDTLPVSVYTYLTVGSAHRSAIMMGQSFPQRYYPEDSSDCFHPDQGSCAPIVSSSHTANTRTIPDLLDLLNDYIHDILVTGRKIEFRRRSTLHISWFRQKIVFSLFSPPRLPSNHHGAAAQTRISSNGGRRQTWDASF